MLFLNMGSESLQCQALEPLLLARRATRDIMLCCQSCLIIEPRVEVVLPAGKAAFLSGNPFDWTRACAVRSLGQNIALCSDMATLQQAGALAVMHST